MVVDGREYQGRVSNAGVVEFKPDMWVPQITARIAVSRADRFHSPWHSNEARIVVQWKRQRTFFMNKVDVALSSEGLEPNCQHSVHGKLVHQPFYVHDIHIS